MENITKGSLNLEHQQEAKRISKIANCLLKLVKKEKISENDNEVMSSFFQKTNFVNVDTNYDIVFTKNI